MKLSVRTFFGLLELLLNYTIVYGVHQLHKLYIIHITPYTKLYRDNRHFRYDKINKKSVQEKELAYNLYLKLFFF